MSCLLLKYPSNIALALPDVGSGNSISSDERLADILDGDNETLVSLGINTILLIDRTVSSRRIGFFVKNRNWMVNNQIDPNVMFAEIFNELSSDVVVGMYDQNGDLFYESSTEPISSYSESRVIDLTFSRLTYEIYLTSAAESSLRTDSANIVMIVSVIINILIILAIIGTFIIVSYVSKVNVIRIELNNLKNIRAIENGVSIIMHEIKNMSQTMILTIEKAILENRKHNDEMNGKNLEIIKENASIVTNMAIRAVDYQKLVMGKFAPEYHTFDLDNEIDKIIRKFDYFNITVESDKMYPIIMTDTLAFKEILHNGISNVPPDSENVQIRYQTIDNYLLFEIINRCEGFNPKRKDIEEYFLPFFIDPHDEIWKETLVILKKNESLYNTIKTGFTNDLEVIRYHNKSGNVPLKKRSAGLGLSISRLLAKALGGDCGLDSENENVTFWFAIQIVNSNNYLDMDSQV